MLYVISFYYTYSANNKSACFLYHIKMFHTFTIKIGSVVFLLYFLFISFCYKCTCSEDKVCMRCLKHVWDFLNENKKRLRLYTSYFVLLLIYSEDEVNDVKYYTAVPFAEFVESNLLSPNYQGCKSDLYVLGIAKRLLCVCVYRKQCASTEWSFLSISCAWIWMVENHLKCLNWQDFKMCKW